MTFNLLKSEFRSIKKCFFTDKYRSFFRYSYYKHLVPFSIAALLLLILSINQDIKTLVNVLQTPNAVLVPVFILTVIAGYIYFVTIKIQVQKFYLLSNYDSKIISVSSLLFFAICFIVTEVVLWYNNISLSIGSIWASILISFLSLTGIQWAGPSSWIESVGIVSPDYREGREAAVKLGNTLENIRSKSVAEEKDMDDFLDAAKNLCKKIYDNLELEPENMKLLMNDIRDALIILIAYVKEFKATEPIQIGVSNFYNCCVSRECVQYNEFTTALINLSNCWPKWSY